MFHKYGNLESAVRGCTFNPQLANVGITLLLSEYGMQFRSCRVKETVDFRYRDQIGSFTHSRYILLSLITNYTDWRNLIKLLEHIACYVKWGWTTSRATSKSEIISETRRKVRSSPWTILLTTKENFNLTTESVFTIGILALSPSAEYISPSEAKLCIVNGMIIAKGTKQGKEINLNEENTGTLSDEVQSSQDDGLSGFQETHENFLSFISWKSWKLKEYVRKRRFDQENKDVVKFLGHRAKPLSKACRDILIHLLEEDAWDPIVAPFLFSFTCKEPTMVDTALFKTNIGNGFIIDIRANEGVFVYTKETESYTLFGVDCGKTSRLKLGNLYQHYLSGYRVDNEIDPDLSVKSLNWVETNYSKLKDGKKLYIYISMGHNSL